MRKLLVLFLVLGTLLLGNPPAGEAVPLSQDGHEFLGEWVVSKYEEGGALTLTYDGTIVTISNNGSVFLLDGPTSTESETRFRVSGNKLLGVYKPDVPALKERFPTAPGNVIPQAVASGKAIYNVNLTLLDDGRILVESDNLQLFWMRNAFGSNFHHATQHPGWIKYTLVKKGANLESSSPPATHQTPPAAESTAQRPTPRSRF